MAFKDFPDQRQGVQLLQRSLERGRLGHGYLFVGHELEPLEALAITLAKTLNCRHPVERGGAAIDCCDQCVACRKTEHGNHPDVHWMRPESKMRVITVEQTRELIREIQLRPTEAEYKVAVVVGADRMKTEAANAFLKTLEEPPAKSILALVTTEPQRLLETIRSRCLRLNFGAELFRRLPSAQLEWLSKFTSLAAANQKSLMGRYRLMDVLLGKLTETKASIEQTLTARSPLQQYPDAEKDFVERWESELAAAIEAEYRRQRSDLLAILQAWLRDVWIEATVRGSRSQAQSPKSKVQSPKPGVLSPRPVGGSLEAEIQTSQAAVDGPESGQLLNFPQLEETRCVAQRISPTEALENLEVLEQLQRWLYTNVQEALALEVGLLKLRL